MDKSQTIAIYGQPHTVTQYMRFRFFDGLIKRSFNFFSFNKFIQIKICHYPNAYAGTILEMLVTKTEGDNIITEIDHQPATEVYSKYLNVKPNRYYKIIETIKLSEDDHTPISLIFMDIDHFKHVNDTYGHDVGDMVLRATVDLIKDNLQSQHVFGRWGGEEFLYLLPDTALEAAREFAENLRMQVEENCYVVVQHAGLVHFFTMLNY